MSRLAASTARPTTAPSCALASGALLRAGSAGQPPCPRCSGPQQEQTCFLARGCKHAMGWPLRRPALLLEMYGV